MDTKLGWHTGMAQFGTGEQDLGHLDCKEPLTKDGAEIQKNGVDQSLSSDERGARNRYRQKGSRETRLSRNLRWIPSGSPMDPLWIASGSPLDPLSHVELKKMSKMCREKYLQPKNY